LAANGSASSSNSADNIDVVLSRNFVSSLKGG